MASCSPSCKKHPCPHAHVLLGPVSQSDAWKGLVAERVGNSPKVGLSFGLMSSFLFVVPRLVSGCLFEFLFPP